MCSNLLLEEKISCSSLLLEEPAFYTENLKELNNKLGIRSEVYEYIGSHQESKQIVYLDENKPCNLPEGRNGPIDSDLLDINDEAKTNNLAAGINVAAIANGKNGSDILRGPVCIVYNEEGVSTGRMEVSQSVNNKVGIKQSTEVKINIDLGKAYENYEGQQTYDPPRF